MSFASLDALTDCMRRLGAKRLYAKALAENDNSKQQIYLGGSFEVLQHIPFTNLREEVGGKRPNFKATVDLRWVSAEGNAERAEGTQLILYPDYPEVRLSGFLRGCSVAPSEYMRPVPQGERKFYNSQDGRVLFFGVADDGTVFARLELPSSPVAGELKTWVSAQEIQRSRVFWEIPLFTESNNRDALIAALREIHLAGWHKGCRLDSAGNRMPYQAQNGGGYTLEALLGVKPNGRAEPDYLGFEIKGFSGYRVTLMTPEPDLGLYGSKGVEAFVRTYGKASVSEGKRALYFTGIHRIGKACESSGQTLLLEGFDAQSGKIVDVSGAIRLVDSLGQIAAGWSFKRLMEHWARKHALAAYVPFEKNSELPPSYRYLSPVLIGEGTAFEMYLRAMASGHVVYDPAPKVTELANGKSRVKARNQFRINSKSLGTLYRSFGPEPLAVP